MIRMRSAALATAFPLLLSGCWRVLDEVGQYAFDHTLGVKTGPCPALMDSVKAARGKPYRRFLSDEEDVQDHTQIFWHEWGYRLPLDSGRTRKDSVTVVGFLWGQGVRGCQVIERRDKIAGRYGPWENAGDLPPEYRTLPPTGQLPFPESIPQPEPKDSLSPGKSPEELRR